MQDLLELVERLEAAASTASTPTLNAYEMRTAVIQGVKAHAGQAVRMIGWRNVLLAAGLLVGATGLGFAGGTWWTSDRMAAQVISAQAQAAEIYNRSVAISDGFGTTLSLPAADGWMQLIRMNPAPDLATCYAAASRAVVPQGQKCTITLWSQPPVAVAANAKK